MRNFTHKEITKLLTLQDNLNKKVNADYITRHHLWHVAIIAESAEALDYIGSADGVYPWWKIKPLRRDDLILEAIDILHFTLSALLQANGGNIVESATVYDGYSNGVLEGYLDHYTDTPLEILLNIIKHAPDTTLEPRMSVKIILDLLALCDYYGTTVDTVINTYVSKYLLNTLRQGFGYKGGTYRRTWSDGRDDNDHLLEVMANAEDITDTDTLYAELVRRYCIQ